MRLRLTLDLEEEGRAGFWSPEERLLTLRRLLRIKQQQRRREEYRSKKEGPSPKKLSRH